MLQSWRAAWRIPGFPFGGAKASGKAPAEPSSELKATPGVYRVLMVDDEDLIRRLATGMARRLQVELMTAATPDDALAIAQTTRIDALVADVLLGDGLNGIELARQIAARQPWVAVVLMSGYAADDFTIDGLPARTQFLSKPFNSHSLGQCLSRARGEDPSPPH